jgi:hypothetical protein
MEAGSFGASVWRHSTFWSRAIDKGIYPEVLEVRSDRTATPLPHAFHTTFWGYRSFPAWDLDDNGVAPWLLSIGLRGRRRHRPWLPYCPSCWHDDDDPYCRRQWRLMFVTVCPRHRCQLLDRCVACGAPCNIDHVPSDANAITHCYRCQCDARRAQASPLDHTASRHCLLQLQTLLIEGLHRGLYPLSRTQLVSTEEFLSVLRHLGRWLGTRKRSGGATHRVMRRDG